MRHDCRGSCHTYEVLDLLTCAGFGRVKLQAYKQKIEEDKELDKIRVELEDIAQNSGHFENEITAVLGNIDRLILAYNADRWA